MNHLVEDIDALFIDLDGTLVKTDTLWESVLVLAKTSLAALFLVPVWLIRGGKSRLKDEIARRVSLNVETLPYSVEVVKLIKHFSDRRVAVVLATAANMRIAVPIAKRLGIAETVIASSHDRNIKGAVKLDAIVKYLGQGRRFGYVGNSTADEAIWRAAHVRFVVNASGRLAKRMQEAGATVLSVRRHWAGPLLKAIRPHQWVKNLLVFVPLATAHRFFEPAAVGAAVIAFLSFSSCASGVYLLNDLLDLDADRRHPKKQHRPFAAGQLPIPIGLIACAGFFGGAFSVALLFLPFDFVLVLGGYALTTMLYTFRLKSFVMLDVAVLASLYTIRVIAGAEAIHVPLSFWLLSFSMFLFLSLALVKRYSEILNLDARDEGRAHGRAYSVEDKWVISQLGTGSALLSVVVLALYVDSPAVTGIYSNPKILWLLCPLLLYWVGRLWLLAARGKIAEDPIVFAAKDYRTLFVVLLGGIIFLSAL